MQQLCVFTVPNPKAKPKSAAPGSDPKQTKLSFANSQPVSCPVRLYGSIQKMAWSKQVSCIGFGACRMAARGKFAIVSSKPVLGFFCVEPA